MKTHRFALVPVAFAWIAASQTFPDNCNRAYVVRPGDYCDKICADIGVSTYQLFKVNQGIINAECTNLSIGQQICLGIVGQDCLQVHVVVSGDTCNAIATAKRITFRDILVNNPNVNEQCTNIYPGEVLCVAPAWE